MRADADAGLARSLRRARVTHAACRNTERTAPGAACHPQHGDVPRHAGKAWSAAFALLLVANMISPVASGIPRGATHRAPASARSLQGRDEDPSLDDAQAVASSPMRDASDGVAVRPVAFLPVKSDYTLSEFLGAVAASSAPFQHTGGALLQMYTLVTGDTVDAGTRRSIDQWTEALDFATGLIPDVGLSRIPGEAAGIAADGIDGRVPDAGRLMSVVQSGDARNWQSRGIVRARPDFARMHQERRTHAGHRSDASHSVVAARSGPNETPSSLPEPVGAALSSASGAPRSGNGRATLALPEWHIEGEQEHLLGYAQSLSAERLPDDRRSRLVLLDGRHYLRGEAGYYHAMRGRSADHWLVSAPRGSGHVAQVPVTYDPATGAWHAQRPLRLCGGGCGPSRAASPDSIAVDRQKIFDALAHLRDDHARDGIRYAFNDLSLLHLTRSNRPDLHMMRDNSIIDHREALRASMKRIGRDLPLVRQQEEASLITTMHYYWNRYSEAFCQENSEILFHYLLANSIPTDRLRMITVQPKNRPPHVLVLYTESERLIDLLESATPQPPQNLEPDGINDMLFAREIYESRDSTVLLDPWSRARATSFANANHAVDLVDALDAAFSDIGHRPGNRYRVSITRPLGARRGSTGRRGSMGSQGSSGSNSLSSQSTGATSWNSATGPIPGPSRQSVDLPHAQPVSV
ncbi:hypothetical protein UC34_02045 [Pandoraea vervacti]|uniref:Uncharacterized protein n=2 Tax=Pandoraea vervacti TaxID=656178 RepID=A0ABN4FL09_9BURK|nr:hypothetical protein UC34_02045 [Pandoraea vervacti]